MPDRVTTPRIPRSRLARITEIHGNRAWDEARCRDGNHLRQLAVLGPQDLVGKLSGADPTPTNEFTQWLATTYSRGGFRLEDLGKARETLELFLANRSVLSHAERDVGRHRDLGSLWKAVSRFAADPLVSNREEDRRERDAARAESVVLLERDDGFTVAVPMTERAARWWGRGTRWCTSASKDNMFGSHHAEAPLVVVVHPRAGKMQVHAAAGRFQFMDAADRSVERGAVDEAWDDIGPVLEWAVGRSGQAVEAIPDARLTASTARAAVRTAGLSWRSREPGLPGTGTSCGTPYGITRRSWNSCSTI